MDLCGEFFPFISKIICLETVVAVVGVSVEVDAHHDGVFVSVGDGATVFEVEKAILSPSHGDGNLFGFEEFFYF